MISSAPLVENGLENPAVTLLFAADRRPDEDAVSRLAAMRGGFSISLDVAAAADHQRRAGDGVWIELVANGLTFDLAGLAGGPAAGTPPLKHAYALPKGLDTEGLMGISLKPGPHLASGTALVPVLRSLAGLGAELARLDDVQAVCWHSSGCWSEAGFFSGAVGRWIEGGAFPGFALAALTLTEGGAMQSDGLALFTGQELRIEAELVDDPSAAGKLGLRLLDYLVNHGSLTVVEGVTAPDGTGLKLEPSRDGRFVRVWRA